MNDLIYGKSTQENIVAIELKGNVIHKYIADGNKTKLVKEDYQRFMLLREYDRSRSCGRLEGSNYFKYFTKFNSKSEMWQYKRQLDYQEKDYWKCNDVEGYMITKGDTLYKGMQLKDVSVLSFDIETTGVKLNGNSYVTLISNTFRDRNGNITRKLFSFDTYESPKHFIEDWCKWVRQVNPDIILGHNIYGFDFKYLQQFAKNYKAELKLGRDGSKLKIQNFERKFRRDGSQDYMFNNVEIFGRNVIDTFFMSFRYDVLRKYPNNKLKGIIDFEGLEKEGRQFWDFDKHKEPWNNAEQWKQFKQYAEEDADDALKLFDLFVPQFFYYTQSIPKSFQEVGVSGTGSQVNSFMMRAYLQRGQSVPKASEGAEFEGAISIGNAGLYKNVYKIDVASLYPSIMLVYNITDQKKDPDNIFLKAVKWFTDQRLEDKRLAAETGDRYYKDMSNGRKIMINSFYGFMGAHGLNFNYPKGAAEVTRHGRRILTDALNWAEENSHVLVNADTDSISFVPNGEITMNEVIKQVNKLSPDGIKWEDDGIYDGVIVVKAKNYLLKQGDKLTYKGSALKATMKEIALKNFLKDALALLLEQDVEGAVSLYNDAAHSIKYLQDISEWCSKKTITDAVLNPKRTTEQRILDAIGDKPVQEGDKIRVFFKSDTEVCLEENFDGVYDDNRMYEKLFKTVKVLAPVLDLKKFPNYKLVRNKKLLESL